MVKSNRPSHPAVIPIFAIVAIVEELAPMNPDVWLTTSSAHWALSGSGRTQAFEPGSLASHPAFAAQESCGVCVPPASLSPGFFLSEMSSLYPSHRVGVCPAHVFRVNCTRLTLVSMVIIIVTVIVFEWVHQKYLLDRKRVVIFGSSHFLRNIFISSSSSLAYLN